MHSIDLALTANWHCVHLSSGLIFYAFHMLIVNGHYYLSELHSAFLMHSTDLALALKSH